MTPESVTPTDTTMGHSIAHYEGEGDARVAVVRMSALNSCTGALWASLQGFEPTGPGDKMQTIFNAGHAYEDKAIAALEADGYFITARQETVEVTVGKGLLLRGHIDGKIRGDAWEGLRFFDVKSMAPSSFKSWMKDRWNGSDLFGKYAISQSAYMEGLNFMPGALIAVCKRDDGEIEDMDVFLYDDPPAKLAPVKARLLKMLKATEMPACPTPFQYPCPYFHMHEGADFGAPGTEIDASPATTTLLAQFMAQKKIRDAAEKVLDELKPRVLEVIGANKGITTGKFKATRIESDRTNFDKRGAMKDHPTAIPWGDYESTTHIVGLKVEEV